MSEKPTYEELEKRICELENRVRTASLAENQKHYRQILDCSPSVIYTKDLEGRYTYINKQFETLSGLKSEEVIGKTDYELFPAQVAENSTQNDKQVIQTGTPKEIEEYGPVDGKMYTFVSTKYPLMDEGGKIYGIGGLSSDIIESANLAQELREKDKLFRTAIKHSPSAIVVSEGIDQVVIMVNDRFTDLFGYTKEDVPDVAAWWVLAYPDKTYREKIRIRWTKAVENSFSGQSQVQPMEVIIACKDGTLKEVSVEAATVGEVNLVAFVDMTERKQTENTLRERETRYRTILQTAIDGFWITDIEGHFLEVNAAYSKMSGYSHAELLAMNISDIEANEKPEEIKEHIKKGIRIGHDRFESVHRRKDNSIYHVEVNFSYLDKEGGRFVSFIKDISERKNAEDKLLRNQYYLTKAQEIGKIGTWELNIQKNSLIWTDESYKIFGVPLGTKLNYEIFLSCIHPEDRDYVNKKWNEALKIKSYDIMHRVVADNKVKWVREKADIEFDSEGNPTIAVGFTQDLTGLKETENALQESEKKFKIMFEKAPLSYQSLDENGCFNEVNQTWLNTMGYTREEVLGKNFSEFLVPAWKDHFKKNFPQFKVVGEILGVEFEMVKKNGDIILVSFHGKIAKNEIGGFKQTHCIFQDITSARQAEESSKRLKGRLESLWNITKIADSDIEIISDHVLEEAQKMTQSRYAFYGVIDKSEKDMVLHAWSHETMDDCKTKEKKIHFAIDKAGIWTEAVKQKQILTINDFNLDRPEKKGMPDGHVQLTRLMVVPYIKNDKVISIVAVANKDAEYSKEDEKQVLAFMRNVQLLIDRKTAEQEADDLAIQLQQMQKMESIGNLAGGIAHDFNNLLFPIIGMSELLLEDLPSNSLEYENAKEIFNAGKRASELVQQILAFSRQSEPKMVPVRVQNIVREVLKLSRSTIPTDIDIVQDIQTDCGSVRGDATQIHQVVINLITNAYHAVQEKSGKIKVLLKQVKLDSESLPDIFLEQGECIHLSVSDTGVGIEHKDLPKIFEPYFTTKEKGKGTGLGLAVVFGIIKEHQGDIQVYSEVGIGTTFNVYLPLISQTTKSMHIGQSEEIELGTERILLVDDEISIAKLESQILLRLGYRVTQQTSSIDALNLFKSNPENFDLVITDMTMPKMTGDRLAREILRIRPDTPIIICTGFSERVNEERSKSIGVKGFLMKPVVKSDMAKMVKKVLNESKKAN